LPAAPALRRAVTEKRLFEDIRWTRPKADVQPSRVAGGRPMSLQEDII
jgi:hypothetical protein